MLWYVTLFAERNYEFHNPYFLNVTNCIYDVTGASRLSWPRLVYHGEGGTATAEICNWPICSSYHGQLAQSACRSASVGEMTQDIILSASQPFHHWRQPPAVLQLPRTLRCSIYNWQLPVWGRILGGGTHCWNDQRRYLIWIQVWSLDFVYCCFRANFKSKLLKQDGIWRIYSWYSSSREFAGRSWSLSSHLYPRNGVLSLLKPLVNSDGMQTVRNHTRRRWLLLGLKTLSSISVSDPLIVGLKTRSQSSRASIELHLLYRYFLASDFEVTSYSLSLVVNRIGTWNHENIADNLHTISVAVFTRGLGWTVEELGILLVDVRKETKDTKIHVYLPVYITPECFLCSGQACHWYRKQDTLSIGRNQRLERFFKWIWDIRDLQGLCLLTKLPVHWN